MIDDRQKMWQALKLCDDYFSACAKQWAKNEGRLVSESGELIEGSDELEALCNQAANAVAALVHGQ